jgi:hypothetical protein
MRAAAVEEEMGEAYLEAGEGHDQGVLCRGELRCSALDLCVEIEGGKGSEGDRVEERGGRGARAAGAAGLTRGLATQARGRC